MWCDVTVKKQPALKPRRRSRWQTKTKWRRPSEPVAARRVDSTTTRSSSLLRLNDTIFVVCIKNGRRRRGRTGPDQAEVHQDQQNVHCAAELPGETRGDVSPNSVLQMRNLLITFNTSLTGHQSLLFVNVHDRVNNSACIFYKGNRQNFSCDTVPM